MDLSPGFLGILLVLMLLGSAFLSMAETSLMSAKPARLRTIGLRGREGARVAALLARTDRYLALAQFGTTLLNATAAAVTALLVLRLGDPAWLLPALLLVTLVIVVLCKRVPKVLGMRHAERVALLVSPVLALLLWLVSPMLLLVRAATRWLVRDPVADSAVDAAVEPLRVEEVRLLMQEAGLGIPKKHQSVLLNLFDLDQSGVEDVMTPRHQIEAIDLAAPVEDIRRQLVTCHHTRLPVCEGQLDNIVGVLHVRRALHLLQTDDLDSAALRSALREPYFIPAGTPLFVQLQSFQENRRRLGMVVDEYGELLGLVSLEDILEEIVGEFTTVAPGQVGGLTEQNDGSWVVDGSLSLRTLNRRLGLDFPTRGPKTLNGLITEHLEDIPEAGTSLKIHEQPIEILQTQGRVVKVARIFPRPVGGGGPGRA